MKPEYGLLLVLTVSNLIIWVIVIRLSRAMETTRIYVNRFVEEFNKAAKIINTIIKRSQNDTNNRGI